ncbi:MAG: trypsin-like peptidase domain-containing protein [Acidimicrobiales bacterium]
MRRVAALALMVSTSVLGIVACSSSAADDPAANDPAAGVPTTASGTTTDVSTATAAVPESGIRTFDQIPDLVSAAIGSVFTVVTSLGEGSGVMLSDGTAVTNAHVVGSDTQLEVILASGRQLPARVVGTDPLVDLAVLDLGASDVPGLELASDLPEVGSLAVAIGSPLGFENTVSVGVVSGLERSIPGGGPSLVGLIQTDAAISPGNSGGALLGPDGTVIGINVAYLPPSSSGAVSIGFAIPAPLVADVAGQLRAGGPVRHAFAGVRVGPVTPPVAEQLGLDRAEGALIVEVVSGGPAAAAGIRPGDVVVGVGEAGVRSVGDFLAALRSAAPGDTVAMRIVRDGGEQSVDVTLDDRPPAS